LKVLGSLENHPTCFLAGKKSITYHLHHLQKLEKEEDKGRDLEEAGEDSTSKTIYLKNGATSTPRT